MIEGKIEQAITLMSDIITVYLKDSELRKKMYYIVIDLALMWTDNSYVYNKYNVLYFICEIIKQLKLESICLF